MKRKLPKQSKAQAGVTLIEVLVAGAVLTIGLLGILPLMLLAAGDNGRSKHDSTSTMLAQGVIEQINAKLSGGGPEFFFDCQGNQNPVSWAPGGAPLKSDGNIDFSQPADPQIATGYAMLYKVCPGTVAPGAPTVYDVRWNIQNITAPDGISKTSLVTVGAKPVNFGPAQFTFALPVTMRLFVADIDN